MAMDFPTGEVTLVFTDLEGSSELSEKHGAAFEAARMEHFDVLREAAARFDGYEVETAGDALFVAFSKAAGAVQFAVAAQQAMAAHQWPETMGELRVRIGMHTGEPFIGEDKGRPTYRGPVTNKAARVQSAGHGGQSLISDATAQASNGHLPPAITFFDCGLHRLKGVGEEHLWQVNHATLRAEFPALNTLNARRHNLPVPLLTLIGREAEIADWRTLLLEPRTRLLTLTGFGGLGKTRSALQLAELCVGDFGDGVWWIELEETRSSEELIARIALVLRLQLQPNLPLKEQLWHYLHERKLLLVLDNTEQNPQAPQSITELLREAPGVTFLVTTRRALGLRTEILREVPPLPPDEAARLFEEAARLRRADFALGDENRADVSEICRRLEGVPLALELAASRIASLSPHDIVRHLDQRFKVLQTRSPDLPPRQRALRGAIDWSYDLLSEDDQSLFAQLAVFARGFTLDDAEAVCEVFDIFEGVQELRDQSLLRVENDASTGQSRFVMLESVREYAEEKLQITPQLDATVRLRHATYFQEFAETRIAGLRTAQEAQALHELEVQQDNIRAALDWSAGHDEPTLCVRLALALGIFLQRRGLINQALRCLEIGLQKAPQVVNTHPALVAQVWRERAGHSIDTLETAAAVQGAEQALLLFTQAGDVKGQAEATNILGLAAKREGDWTYARQYFHAALALYREVGDEIGVAIVRTNLGATECEDPAGDSAVAADYLHEALIVRRRHDDRRGIAEALNNLGVLAQNQGHLEEAQECYEEALRFEQQLENTIGVARVLYNLSEIAETRAEWTRSLRCALTSALLFEEIGSPLRRYAQDLYERVAQQITDEENAPELHAQIKSKTLNEAILWALD